MSPSVFASTAAGVCRFAPLFVVVVVRPCYHVNEQKGKRGKKQRISLISTTFSVANVIGFTIKLRLVMLVRRDMLKLMMFLLMGTHSAVLCVLCCRRREEKRKSSSSSSGDGEETTARVRGNESWKLTIHTSQHPHNTNTLSNEVEFRNSYHLSTLNLAFASVFQPDDTDLLSSENKENN